MGAYESIGYNYGGVNGPQVGPFLVFLGVWTLKSEEFSICHLRCGRKCVPRRSLWRAMRDKLTSLIFF
jgi:hypothetical protein